MHFVCCRYPHENQRRLSLPPRRNYLAPKMTRPTRVHLVATRSAPVAPAVRRPGTAPLPGRKVGARMARVDKSRHVASAPTLEPQLALKSGVDEAMDGRAREAAHEIRASTPPRLTGQRYVADRTLVDRPGGLGGGGGYGAGVGWAVSTATAIEAASAARGASADAAPPFDDAAAVQHALQLASDAAAGRTLSAEEVGDIRMIAHAFKLGGDVSKGDGQRQAPFLDSPSSPGFEQHTWDTAVAPSPSRSGERVASTSQGVPWMDGMAMTREGLRPSQHARDGPRSPSRGGGAPGRGAPPSKPQPHSPELDAAMDSLVKGLSKVSAAPTGSGACVVPSTTGGALGLAAPSAQPLPRAEATHRGDAELGLPLRASLSHGNLSLEQQYQLQDWQQQQQQQSKPYQPSSALWGRPHPPGGATDPPRSPVTAELERAEAELERLRGKAESGRLSAEEQATFDEAEEKVLELQMAEMDRMHGLHLDHVHG